MPTYASITFTVVELNPTDVFLIDLMKAGFTGQKVFYIQVTPVGPNDVEEGHASIGAGNLRSTLSAYLDPADYTVGGIGNQVSITALKLGNQYNFGTVETSSDFGSSVSINSQVDNDGTTMSVLTESDDDVSCNGAENGEITLTVQNYYQSFTVAWTKQGDAGFNESGNPIEDLAPGTYDYVITDFVGNEISGGGIAITQPTAIAIAVDAVVNASGPGATDGSIAITPSGGTPGYTYVWTKDNDFAFNETSQDITGLGGGTYRCTVTDANGCTKVVVQAIAEPGQFQVTGKLVENDLITTVIGGTAPYTYDWSNGATTKDLTGIAPGTYSVVVTDVNDFTTEATFVVNDFKFWFSKNPIYLALAAEDPGTKQNLTFICKLFVESSYESDVYTKIADMEQPADENGETVFRLEKLLDAYVSSQLPGYNQAAISRAENIFSRYYVEFLEKYGDPAVESFTKQLTVSYVVLGGLSFVENSANTFFSSYLPSNKPFLSWQPLTKKVFGNQQEFLYYIVDSFDTTEIKLMVEVTDDQDNTEELEIASLDSGINRYEVYILPAGYSQLDIEGNTALVDPIVSYKVYVKDQADNVVSEERNYVLDSDYFPYRKDFLFLNSMGGFDTLVCTGKTKTSLQTKQQSVEKILPYNYATSDFEKDILNKSGMQKMDFSTTYISKQLAERLQDFLISPEVYLLENNRFIRVEIQAQTYKVDDENETLWYIEGTYSPSEMNQFTPNL